jgi:hypothetical protein
VKLFLSNKQGVKDLDDEKWILVDHSRNKRMKGHTASLAKSGHDICSNCFAPLSNLNKNSTDEVVLKCINEGLTPSGSMDNAINHPIKGNKVPTIINGQVTNGHIKKLTKTLVNSPCNFKDIINTFNHEVKIIGDSCLRGLSTKLNQYLNTKFEVCSFLKPGVSINQIVNSEEMEFKCLGKKDVIVINGGTNDFDIFSINKN